jgi:hypothetical protein
MFLKYWRKWILDTQIGLFAATARDGHFETSVIHRQFMKPLLNADFIHRRMVEKIIGGNLLYLEQILGLPSVRGIYVETAFRVTRRVTEQLLSWGRTRVTASCRSVREVTLKEFENATTSGTSPFTQSSLPCHYDERLFPDRNSRRLQGFELAVEAF